MTSLIPEVTKKINQEGNEENRGYIHLPYEILPDGRLKIHHGIFCTQGGKKLSYKKQKKIVKISDIEDEMEEEVL